MLRPRHSVIACPRGCRNISRISYRAPRRVSIRKSLFPHGFSATEHLVPPSEDNSTPITDSLPRSPLLDPTTYKRKHIKHRVEPPRKSAAPLTAFEQSILENPFAKILASPIRRDRLAEQALPRNLLLKYIIYASNDDTHWLMPGDLSPNPKTSVGLAVRGVYARLNRRSVEELGAKQRRWKSLVPETTNPAVRKSLVWRDGMAEWIGGVLRLESGMRLDGLRRMYLFACEVDEDVQRAVVGGNIGKRIKLRKEEKEEEGLVDKEGHEGAEVRVSEPEVEGVTLPETETTGEVEAQSSAMQTESTVLEDLPKKDQGNKGPIIAVLYLSPPETSVPWEFQSIHIEGQETQAVVFNLRRLFPATAESYMKLRVGEGNAVAVMSSEMTCTILYYMLRLALYLEGEGKSDSPAEKVEEGNVDADVESGNELKVDLV